MKRYKTITDINKDLRRLYLERQIALEELKVIEDDFKESFKTYHWIESGLKLFSKYGFLLLIKKIFR